MTDIQHQEDSVDSTQARAQESAQQIARWDAAVLLGRGASRWFTWERPVPCETAAQNAPLLGDWQLCAEDHAVNGYEPVTAATLQRYLVLIISGSEKSCCVQVCETLQEVREVLTTCVTDSEDDAYAFDLDRTEPLRYESHVDVTITFINAEDGA